MEVARFGITVNAVAPGLIDTPMTATLVSHPAESKQYLERVPLRRFGEPGDIAGAVAFLSGPDAAWITGHELVVDGGQTIGIDVPIGSFVSDQGVS